MWAQVVEIEDQSKTLIEMGHTKKKRIESQHIKALLQHFVDAKDRKCMR